MAADVGVEDDAKRVVAEARKAGIYLIGRVVVFEDPTLTTGAVCLHPRVANENSRAGKARLRKNTRGPPAAA